MDYSVDFSELRSAGDQFESLQSTGNALVRQVQSVPLVESDFGRIPWLQNRVWDAYCEHTVACLDALEELSETLGKIDEGLDACADAYETFEESAEQACIEFFGQAG